MDKIRVNFLLKRFSANTINRKELNELMKYISQAESDHDLFVFMEEVWNDLDQDNSFDDIQADLLYQKIIADPEFQQVPKIEKRSFVYLKPWISIAASVLFCVFIGLVATHYLSKSPQTIAYQKPSPKDAIVPGGNKAVLTLADGSSILLDSTQHGTLAKQGNAKVMKLNTATLAYNAEDENSQEIVYNTLSTPSGGQYQLILPDGTKVWLNASSSIHFPTIFKGKERTVEVTGEAYFEVERNADMPFKITVNEMEVKVLGTHFNINAYDNESSMNTTLLEGSVKISKGSLNKTLIPGQQSRINKTGNIDIVAANIDEVMAWKNGWFQFNAYDIEKVMRQISRWYDVEVVYQGKIPEGHFSGLVSRQNDISQVLKILQVSGVRFKIEGRKVIILS